MSGNESSRFVEQTCHKVMLKNTLVVHVRIYSVIQLSLIDVYKHFANNDWLKTINTCPYDKKN